MVALQSSSPATEAMQALRIRFIQRIAETTERLDGFAEDIVQGVNVRQNSDQIVSELHRISGLAGSFGFGDLGAEAGELEMDFRQWLDEGEQARSMDDLLFDLETHVACLDEVAREAGF